MAEFLVDTSEDAPGVPVPGQGLPADSPMSHAATEANDPTLGPERLLKAELDEVQQAEAAGRIDHATAANLQNIAADHQQAAIDILKSAQDPNGEMADFKATVDEQAAHLRAQGPEVGAEAKADALEAIGQAELNLQGHAGDAYFDAKMQIIDASHDIMEAERDIPGIDQHAIDAVQEVNGQWRDAIDQGHARWDDMIEHNHQQLDSNVQDVREGHDPAAQAHDPVDVGPEAHATADA